MPGYRLFRPYGTTSPFGCFAPSGLVHLFESSFPQKWLLAAGGRDDSVHAQVFDHLSVVVFSVAYGKGGNAGPGVGPVSLFYFLECVLRGHGVRCLAGKGKGIFDSFHDFVFAG